MTYLGDSCYALKLLLLLVFCGQYACYFERDVDVKIGKICLSYFRQSTYIYEPPKREDFSVKNIDWLKIQEFSVDRAEAKIKEFVTVGRAVFYVFYVFFG